MCLNLLYRPEGRRYRAVSRTGYHSSAQPKRNLFPTALAPDFSNEKRHPESQACDSLDVF